MILYVVFLLFSSVSAYTIEEECLNYTVYPVQYELTIIPHVYQDDMSYYDCDIIITIIANAPNVNIIELDAKDIEIKGESIQVLDNGRNLVNQYRPYEYDNKKSKLYIYLSESLKQYSISRTQYNIKISFSKQVNNNTDGIFNVRFEEDGKQQFEYSGLAKCNFDSCYVSSRPVRLIFKILFNKCINMDDNIFTNNICLTTKDNRTILKVAQGYSSDRVKISSVHRISGHLYVTRLSPNRAKNFFPCFENPQFEAIFKFKVYEMPPYPGYQYCNTSLVIAKELKRHRSKDSYTIFEYLPSPQVALHQVGFHHSKFGSRQITAKNTNDSLVIWAPVSSLPHYTFILQFGEAIINLIQEYASINRPLVYGPINIVSVPAILNGYEIGSWNLLTNGDNKLANTKDYTSIKQIERMMFELSQQLSRIWLGSPGEIQRTRWREEWFREGFATYLAYYFLTQYNQGEVSSTHRRPLGMYGLQMKHKAMAIDWHHTTPALVSFNRTLAIDIPSRYKDLVTMKTASLLWMVENWLGSKKFHQAIVNYINSRRGKYISLSDFMASTDRETVECLHQFFNGSTTSKVLNSWFHQAGYPVVNVQVLRDRTPNAIQLKQRQFSFTNQNRLDSNYLIPISYIVQNKQNCFNCFQPKFTLDVQTYTFRENLNNGWIILNRNASGYYRVNYDLETWGLIAKTLENDHLAIDELNRAQIVNDIFALYAAGDIQDDIAINVLRYLNKEFSFLVWDSVVSGYQLLKAEGARTTKLLYGEWQNFMQKKVETIYKRLMTIVDQRPKTRLFRSLIVDFACTVKYRRCLNEMRRLYSDHKISNMKLNPDFRETCYVITLNEANYDIGRSLNRFEQEDKSYAEHTVREENRFLYRLPVGQPRPLPIMMSSTTTTTEASTTTIQDLHNKGFKSSLSFIFILAVIINSILR